MGRKAKQPVNQDTENREPEIKKTVKEKKVIDKIILWKDDAKINELQNKLETLLPLAQSLVNSYNSLPFANDDSPFSDILQSTVANARVHLLKTMPDMVPIAGAEYDKLKALDLGLYKCPGLSEFKAALEAFQVAGAGGFVEYFKHADKSVIIDPVSWQRFEDSLTIAAISEEEIALYNQWKNFIETIENFIPLMAKFRVKMLVNNLGPLVFVHTIKVDRQGKWQVNYTLFAEVTKRMRNKE